MKEQKHKPKQTLPKIDYSRPALSDADPQTVLFLQMLNTKDPVAKFELCTQLYIDKHYPTPTNTSTSTTVGAHCHD